MNKILKRIICLITCLTLFTFFGCSINIGTNNDNNSNNGENGNVETVETAEPITDTSIDAEETTGDFSITTEDGEFSLSNNIYTISAAGTYSLSGLLEGQILIDAGDDDEITLELNGVTISYDKDSPIKIMNSGDVEISAKKDTENVIKDNRKNKTADDDSQGEGAIYSKSDLKLKGKGTLVVTANYNNGIHTTNDLEIKNLSLKVTAFNSALKGNDSIEMESGNVVAISTNGDSVKTQNTDANSSGEVRGDIEILGGSITVYAAGDGFQAAHDFISATNKEGTAPAIVIYTGSYSGYTASNASTTSYKGIKVQNELNITAGSINIKSYDDGLHADYGTTFTAGGKGQGTINISGGTIVVNVYSPENKTAGGGFSPGRQSWGYQQTVSGADGIHADYKLNISGGKLEIDSAYEGLEGNLITISGGNVTLAANDDGINACKGNSTPNITITGGFIDVTVSPNGDTDGIDSNGTYTQSGGIVITRGPNSEMAAAIDADNSVSVSGGTIIILGYGSVKTSGSVKSYSLSLHSSGSHTITVDGTTYKFTNSSTYGRTTCYSSVSVSGS